MVHKSSAGYSVMRLLSIKMNLDVLASPLERISNQLFTKKRVNIFIKRDDLIHPVIEGNKFRKLKYNIEEIIKGQFKVIETFGGAYSNHLLSDQVLPGPYWAEWGVEAMK